MLKVGRAGTVWRQVSFGSLCRAQVSKVAVDAWSERPDVMTVELGRVAGNFLESSPEVTSAQAGLR